MRTIKQEIELIRKHTEQHKFRSNKTFARRLRALIRLLKQKGVIRSKQDYFILKVEEDFQEHGI